MKHLIILGDGMADEPIAALGGMTPLQAAHKPHINMLARMGRSGLLTTVPEGFTPGSEIANLGILGYDVAKVYEGRGSLEAASIGVEIEPDEMAMRSNIICVTPDGNIKNHSAGHITTAEADELIQALNRELGSDSVTFHTGISYRHLLKIKGGNKHVKCTPPHDVPGAAIADVLPVAEVDAAEPTARLLRELMLKSQAVLEDHPVNLRRKAEGKDPANMIWPWSPGYRPSMLTLHDLYGVEQGAVISAVDLIKGIGKYAGLEVIEVEGATGLYDTNYEGKAQAAIDALRRGADFVFVHVEASDEAGHEGDAALKIRTIEYLDERIVKPIMAAAAIGSESGTSLFDEPLAIAVLPDHPTPCRIRTHTSTPVPFTIYNPALQPDDVDHFDEFAATAGVYGHITQITEFLPLFLNNK